MSDRPHYALRIESEPTGFSQGVSWAACLNCPCTRRESIAEGKESELGKEFDGVAILYERGRTMASQFWLPCNAQLTGYCGAESGPPPWPLCVFTVQPAQPLTTSPVAAKAALTRR